MTQNQILKAFKDTGALLEGHFELRSKLHSNRYFQCANVLRFPRVAEKLCREVTRAAVKSGKLGKRIDQIHVKNGQKLLNEQELLDWPRLAQEYFDIGYRGWYVLETGSPTGDFVADTKANVEYVRKTFRMPA